MVPHERSLAILVILTMMVCMPAPVLSQDQAPAIEPRVDKILRQMSDYLSSLEKFSFHTENTTEEVWTSGQKVQFGDAVDIFVQRPNKLVARTAGDKQSQELYYNGETITLFGKDTNFYALLEAPATIEAALDHARESVKLEAPLADIVYRDFYRALREDINAGVYVGLHSVDGKQCHHLVLSRDDIDVQVWIEDSETPVPRKLIITEKWVTGAPQFTARITQWDLSPTLKDSLFAFVPPEKARKIEFLPAEKTMAPLKQGGK
jgi:hypothetical protein